MSTYHGEAGTVGILNVGAGDTKLSFDPSNPAERIRAARIVKDMLRRGYALLIEIERDGVKQFTRAVDFDEAVCEYIIADFDPIEAAKHDEQEVVAGANHGNEQEVPQAPSTPAGATGKRPYTKRIKAEGARAVSVARTAGG